MLACLSPVCTTKSAEDELGFPHRGSKPKRQPIAASNKHGIKLLTFQLKQMASRFTAGALQRHCRPACTIVSSRHEGNPENLAAPAAAPDEMNSPQFSLKSYQMNCRTPPGQDSISTPEKRFDSGLQEGSFKAMRSLQQNFADASVKDDGSKAAADKVVDPLKFKVLLDNEWVAQVEPGVYITFSTAQDGYNDLKRIKFSRAMFSKQRAESWWTENCPMIRELYNVRPPSSTCPDDDRFSSGYATPDPYNKSPGSTFDGGDYQLTRRKSAADSRLKDDYLRSDEVGNHSWVEQDESGVYLTIITIPGVGKQLKRVRFSRDKFSEREASAWWERNRQRIYAQYIFTNTRLQGK